MTDVSTTDEHAQPMPVRNDRPSIQSLVRQDLDAREQVGISRYGTSLQPFNGRDMLRDAYDEAMDLTTYLRGVIEERDNPGAFEDLQGRIAQHLHAAQCDGTPFGCSDTVHWQQWLDLAEIAMGAVTPAVQLLLWLHAEAVHKLGAASADGYDQGYQDCYRDHQVADKDAVRAERDQLRSLWPKNGLDEDTDVRQLIVNHRAWSKRDREEAERLRAELDALKASYQQKVNDFARETARVSAMLARCDENAVPIHVVGEAGLGWLDAQKHIRGGIEQADTLFAAQQKGNPEPCATVPTAATPTTAPHGAANAATTSAGTPSTATTGSATASADHPSAPTEPRVWNVGDPQPDDVWKVRDKHGDVWTRNVADSWETPDTMPCGWPYMARKWAPLTEVVNELAEPRVWKLADEEPPVGTTVRTAHGRVITREVPPALSVWADKAGHWGTWSYWTKHHAPLTEVLTDHAPAIRDAAGQAGNSGAT